MVSQAKLILRVITFWFLVLSQFFLDGWKFNIRSVKTFLIEQNRESYKTHVSLFIKDNIKSNLNKEIDLIDKEK